MKSIKVTGVIRYIPLETGFWAIIGDDGQEYRPLNFPEQLKKEGSRVEVKVKEVVEDMSLFMWGIPVKVLGFHTL
ncbi:MAG TPA: hypothetical protein PKA00_19715 [Saprospiraceae bacterium]|nr:hypothetical protein [Saprospiraceae bacterium]HMQ85147.1 hypothetical protein [Saprospiraceae bacterium]